MPISVDRYEALAGEVLKAYEEAERVMMKRVSKRLYKGVDKPGWTEKKYAEVQNVTKELRDFMRGFSADRREMQHEYIRQAYDEASAAMVDDARRFTEVTRIAGLTANTEKVARILYELDKSMNDADRRILRSVNDEYANIVGRTAAQVATGTITYREAVKQELEQFANKGITSFVDKAGRSWDMETYAEMATLTAIERATREGYLDTMQEFGFDLAVISDHYGACPICEAWQGVVVSVSGNTPGYPSMGDAEDAGVFHPRCMHDLSVYHEGISPVGRTEPREITPPSAGYSVRAQQRYYERQERQWKRRMAVAGSPQEERAAYAHVRMYQQRIRELVSDYNDTVDPSVDHLPRKYWREGGRAKMSAAAKKLKPVKLLTDAADGFIMESDRNRPRQPITEESLRAVPRFTEFGTTEANEAVYKACVEILSDMMHHKLGTEETITLPLSKLDDYLRGTLSMKGLKDIGPAGKGKVTPIDINEPYIGLHNHSRCGTFSFNDVDEFGRRPNCIGIVVIGNNGGNAFVLVKGKDFDSFRFSVLRGKIDCGHVIYKANDRFLKGLKSYGIDYSSRRN